MFLYPKSEQLLLVSTLTAFASCAMIPSDQSRPLIDPRDPPYKDVGHRDGAQGEPGIDGEA